MQSLNNQVVDLLMMFPIAFMGASLELAFQHYMQPKMIFNSYAIMLDSLVTRVKQLKKSKDKVQLYLSLLAYLSKPLGLCPYCNGTWVGIFIFLYFYKLDFTLLLFIGLIWFFIRIMKPLHS